MDRNEVIRRALPAAIALTMAGHAPAIAAPPMNLAYSATQAADAYWTARGLPGRCPAQLSLATFANPEQLGVAALPGCTVQIDRRFYADVVQVRSMGWVPRIIRIGVVANLCVLLVHERGHNLGLEHTPTGVMTAELAEPPWECFSWARRLIPRRARAARASRR